jgi:MFS family permease
VVLLGLIAGVRLPETLLLLRLQDVGLPIATAPLVWAVLHVVRSAASYPAGVAADRLGTKPTLVLGAAIYVATIVGLGWTTAAAGSVALFLGHGLAAGLLEPSERAAVAGVVKVRRGRVFGTYQAIAGLAALITGVAFGWLYQRWGGAAALTAGGGLVALVVIAWWLTDGKARRREDLE